MKKNEIPHTRETLGDEKGCPRGRAANPFFGSNQVKAHARSHFEEGGDGNTKGRGGRRTTLV